LGIMNLIKLEGYESASNYLPILEQAVCSLDTTIKAIVEQTNTAQKESHHAVATRLKYSNK
ncbi:MAG TPA: hypothetical protein VHB70_04950, partial [Parafilimonas sp.]|nr:hypothetical protein [Parafilimonas sp.]